MIGRTTRVIAKLLGREDAEKAVRTAYDDLLFRRERQDLGECRDCKRRDCFGECVTLGARS